MHIKTNDFRIHFSLVICIKELIIIKIDEYNKEYGRTNDFHRETISFTKDDSFTLPNRIEA